MMMNDSLMLLKVHDGWEIRDLKGNVEWIKSDFTPAQAKFIYELAEKFYKKGSQDRIDHIRAALNIPPDHSNW